ncbi:MAG TPA: hypothetical protein VIW78_05690 [Burkholderiales bacterium]
MRVLFLALSALFGIPAVAHADPLREEVPSPAATVEVKSVAKDDAGKGFLGKVWSGLTDEAHLSVGYGVVQWAMDVKRASDGATARLVQRDNNAVFIGYGSKPSFFKDTNFGYTFMVDYVNFDMTKQEIPGDQFANLGTEVSGYLVYAVPALYYQWGEHREAGRFVRLGLGVGLGAASYSGTARLSTGEVVSTEKKSFEPRLAVSNFLEARWNHVGLSVSYASPRIYGDGYDIRVSGFSANIGYFYYF